MKKRRIFLPLFIVQGYLCFTLLIYMFGPVQFETHNPFLFYSLMIFYLLAFACGYLVGASTENIGQIHRKERSFSNSLFYVTFFLGLVMVLGAYKNLMLGESLIPFDIFKEVSRGIREPGLAYTERMEKISVGDTSGSRLFNILSLGFSFTKLFFIFICLYFWSDLSFFKKLLAVIYSLLFLSAGFASGTNATIFIFAIFFVISGVCILLIRENRNLKKYMGILSILLFLPILSFGFIMSRRGGGFDYFAGTSPLGDITISLVAPDYSGFFSIVLYSMVWLNYYLVQGYYGFSLILNLDHNWTYGFGNSAFLQRQIEVVFGIDISNSTFQSRISDKWDVSAQWHSLYGQMANDVGLIGVGFLMLFLGLFLSKVWISVIYRNSFYGLGVLPIFGILIIFIPANNQVFGYIDTFSYAIIVTIFWFFEDKKMRFLK